MFRHTLIGYDDQPVLEAEEMAREAIDKFGEGNDESALRLLGRAYNRTPENASIAIWHALIREAMRDRRTRR